MTNAKTTELTKDFYKDKLDTLPFNQVVDLLEEQERLEFIKQNHEKINNYDMLGFALEYFPENERLDFAKQKEELLCIERFPLDILSLLPKDSRIDFAKTYESRIESFELSDVLRLLPDSNKLEFANKKDGLINSNHCLLYVLRVLPNNNKLEFAQQCQKYFVGFKFLELLDDIPEEHKLGFTQLYFRNIITCDEFALNFNKIDKFKEEAVKAYKDKITTRVDLIKIIENINLDYRLMVLDQCNELVVNSYGYELYKFIKLLPQEYRLYFATNNKARIDICKLKYVLQDLNEADRFAFACEIIDEKSKGEIKAYYFESVMNLLPENDRRVFEGKYKGNTKSAIDTNRSFSSQGLFSHKQTNETIADDNIGRVDNSSFQARRPAACPRDPMILLDTQACCIEKVLNGSREQVAGRRDLNCQQTLVNNTKKFTFDFGCTKFVFDFYYVICHFVLDVYNAIFHKEQSSARPVSSTEQVVSLPEPSAVYFAPQKWMLFTTVASDGMGDLSHLEDIVNAIRQDSKFDDVEIVLNVFDEGQSRPRYDAIEERLKKLKVRYYFSGYVTVNEPYNLNRENELMKDVHESCQLISISFDRDLMSRMRYYAPQALLKLIGEHEMNKNMYGINGLLVRSLGLSPDCFGIKISPLPKPSPAEESFATIMQQDENLYNLLMMHSHVENAREFLDKNVLIPAYFSKPNDACDFLKVLSQYGNTLAGNKDMVIYLSGIKDLSNTENSYKLWKHLSGTDITHIEIIEPQASSPTILYLSDNSPMKTLKIFTGFFVTDDSFNAIYQLAPKLAGVSGDNTLERCISMNILPYYYSTNAEHKVETLKALQEISQLPEIEMTAAARRSFDGFFDHDLLVKDKELPIDFKEMIEAWPKITAYLRAHYNFYDKLHDILSEGLQPDMLIDPQETPSCSV